MLRLFFLLILLLSTPLLADEFSAKLEQVRKKYNLPALAAAVTLKGKIVAKGAVGIRKHGTKLPVTVNDKFHIGSCTKSMTATLAGMLVDQGKIKWNSTLKELFPNLEIHEGYQKSSLEQLLSHTAGFPNTENDAELWVKLIENRKLSAEKQRDFLLKTMLKRKPFYDAGSKHVYSNCSVTFAGMMLEKVSGKSWEVLMQEMLAKPLKMETLGFGSPATFGKIDQPLGHFHNGYSIVPVSSSINADNPPAIAPAGTVHCSIVDLAKYTAMYSQQAKRFLKPETFKKVKTVVKDSYAQGWMVLERPWGGKVLYHNGTNTTFYTIMWVAPEKEFSVVVSANILNKEIAKAVDEVASMSIRKFLLKK